MNQSIFEATLRDICKMDPAIIEQVCRSLPKGISAGQLVTITKDGYTSSSAIPKDISSRVFSTLFQEGSAVFTRNDMIVFSGKPAEGYSFYLDRL